MRALAEILTEHEDDDIRRLDPAWPVWEIREPGLLSRDRKRRRTRVAACRSAIWRALRSGGLGLFVRHQDPPHENEVPGSWQRAGKRTWIAPSVFDPDEGSTAAWLALGGWTVYAGRRLAAETVNLFDSPPERVAEWADRHHVPIVVDAFLDDFEWRVYVEASE